MKNKNQAKTLKRTKNKRESSQWPCLSTDADPVRSRSYIPLSTLQLQLIIVKLNKKNDKNDYDYPN